jgi:hypothetical protein
MPDRVPAIRAESFTMRPDETVLWSVQDDDGEKLCVMVSCCAGAELQVRRGEAVLLRELYPDKPTLYERARELKAASHPDQ